MTHTIRPFPQGEVFGFLQVLNAVRVRKGNGTARGAEVQCVCGQIVQVRLVSLWHGNTKSCGCQNPHRKKVWEPLPLTDTDDCVEWSGKRLPKGYGIRWNGKGRTTLVHRQAMEDFLGRILDPSETVMHTVCDNPPCFNVRHLSLGTLALNNAEMAAKGRARNKFSYISCCPKCRGQYGRYTSPVTGDTRRRCWRCYDEYQQLALDRRRAKNLISGH